MKDNRTRIDKDRYWC